MLSLRNVNIGNRLAAGFGLILLCMSAVLALALWHMSALQASTEKILSEDVADLVNALEMRETGQSLALALREVAAPLGADSAKRESKHVETLLAAYQNAEAALNKHAQGVGNAGVLNATIGAKKAILPTIKDIKESGDRGDYFTASSVIKTDFHPLHQQWMDSLATLADHQHGQMRGAYESALASYRTTRAAMLGAGAATLALGLLIAAFITRSITRPLKRAGDFADVIASGDLSAHIEPDARDEAGRLVTSLAAMRDNLLDTVNAIRKSTDTISIASREIAAGNADLSARTESQAGSLGETAASLDQLTATVRQNTENARQANYLVVSATDVALRGGQVVDQVVATMGSIKDSSRKIVDIIGVIDGITFQTNILALNAAVEAARAGEQGRGFAVVAAEVRGLAQRAAIAAREIKELIGDSVQKVDAGGRLVDDAGRTTTEIVSSVQHVANIMSEITSASEEQSNGIEHVNQAIGQMDEMTQQNAALVEQAAAAAESMQEQVRNLRQSVERFRLEQDAPEAHSGYEPSSSAQAFAPGHEVGLT